MISKVVAHSALHNIAACGCANGTVLFDARFGLEKSITDANGLVTTTDYDALGRISAITYPDGINSTQMDYKLCTGCDLQTYQSQAHWYIQSKTSGESAIRTYYDALDREIGTRSKGLNGDYSYSYQTLDRFGRVVANSLAFRSDEIAQVTSTDYDVLSRPVSTTFPDNSIESIAYSTGSSVNSHAIAIKTVTNSLQQATGYFYDGQSRERKVVDALSSEVYYSYDAQGNLSGTEVRPVSGASVFHGIVYDALGRKIQLDDPDTGITTYKYNALGLLYETTDAMNQVIRYAYDVLERQTVRIDRATGASQSHSWVYDNATGAGVGQLASVSGVDTEGAVFTERYNYDNLGRLLTTTNTIKGESYTSTTHYDSLYRVDGLTYPGGFTARYRYSDYGYLQAIENAHGSVGNTTVYWEASDDDAFGNITGYSQGNGVVTSKAFDPQTGLIERIAAIRNSNSIQNHVYDFDTEGNLNWREDAVRSITEHFCYDSLNRLTHSNVGSSCSSGKTITYDYHGNITSRSDVQGNQMYRYGSNAGPHAVTSIGNGNPYTYNAKGEMLSGGGKTGLTYTSYGKPTHMQKGSYYTDIAYDSNQNRIQRIDGGNTFVETTTYIGKLYEKVVTSQKTLERFYIGDSVIRIEETTSNGNYNERTVYLHQDHIGSVAAKTDEAGNIIESLANEPWGKQLSDSWNGTEKAQGYNPEETDRGFTGHEHLTGVGLIHMNGRVYDPAIGRFMSPDPIIQDPLNTQSYNRYTYVFNNPLRYVDPTGFTCEDSGNPDTGGSCTTTAPDLSGDNGGFGQFFDFISRLLVAPDIVSGNIFNDDGINQSQLRDDISNSFVDGRDFLLPNDLSILAEHGADIAGAALADVGVGKLIIGGIATRANKFTKPKEKIENKEKKVGDKNKVTEGVGRTPATAPVGRKNNPLENLSDTPTRNADEVINGRRFTGHSLDQAQNRGLTPSVIDDAIKNGSKSADPIPGRSRNFSPKNNITVITEGNDVITVFPGRR